MTTKNEYSTWKQRGLCSQCGSEKFELETMCTRCSDKLKAKYAKLRDDERCVNCRGPTNGKTRCQPCLLIQSERAKSRRKEYAQKRRCISCGEQAEKKHCTKCLLKMKKLRDDRKEAGLCSACGNIADKTRCLHCEAMNRLSVEKLRDQVFEAYGGASCKCCGESTVEFLALDHINNDGARQRASVGSGGVYRWVRRNGFPPGYQVLCHNCNWGKRVCGICPHQR